MMEESTLPEPLLQGGGAEALIGGKDWSQSPLGAADGWSPVLCSFLAMVLAAKQPMFLVCVTDQVRRLEATTRKPARAETAATTRRVRAV